MSLEKPSPTTSTLTTTTATYADDRKLRHQPPVSYRLPPATYQEECWSADETHALINAWGSLHLSLNRGHLRQSQWTKVASAVNAIVNHRNRRRSDAQCKNRIDTLKKRYKVEKAKLHAKGGDGYVSEWPFFDRLDFLIAGDNPMDSPPVAVPTPAFRNFPVPRSVEVATPVVKRRSAIRRKPARWLTEGDNAVKSDRRLSEVPSISGYNEDEESGGVEQLVEAIQRFGVVYEKVESMKQKRMVELEKHRMEFAKELEFQRMKLLMDIQQQLFSRIKRSKIDHHPHVGED